MNATERAMLEQHLEWLNTDVIPGFERSQQPPSWKAESIRRARQQVANIEWRLSTGKPAPICGWRGLYADHPEDCYYCQYGKNKPSGKPFVRRDPVSETERPAMVTPEDTITTP